MRKSWHFLVLIQPNPGQRSGLVMRNFSVEIRIFLTSNFTCQNLLNGLDILSK